MQFIFSHFDDEQLQEKCIVGMREQLLKGNWVMASPIGFDKIKVNGEAKLCPMNTESSVKLVIS